MSPCPKHCADPNNQLAQGCFVTPGDFSCCSADNSVALILNHDWGQDYEQTSELQTVCAAWGMLVRGYCNYPWRYCPQEGSVFTSNPLFLHRQKVHRHNRILPGCSWRKRWTGGGGRRREGRYGGDRGLGAVCQLSQLAHGVEQTPPPGHNNTYIWRCWGKWLLQVTFPPEILQSICAVTSPGGRVTVWVTLQLSLPHPKLSSVMGWGEVTCCLGCCRGH